MAMSPVTIKARSVDKSEPTPPGWHWGLIAPWPNRHGRCLVRDSGRVTIWVEEDPDSPPISEAPLMGPARKRAERARARRSDRRATLPINQTCRGYRGKDPVCKSTRELMGFAGQCRPLALSEPDEEDRSCDDCDEFGSLDSSGRFADPTDPFYGAERDDDGVYRQRRELSLYAVGGEEARDGMPVGVLWRPHHRRY